MKNKEYEFVLTLEDIDVLDDGAVDALFEAGCDDGTLGSTSGVVTMIFTREAPSLEEAILSAIENVRAAGVEVLHVAEDDFVTQADIARHTKRSRQSISQLIAGERGPGGFPAPAYHGINKTPLWSWRDVAAWFADHGMLDEAAKQRAQTVAAVNASLEFNRYRELAPQVTERLAGVGQLLGRKGRGKLSKGSHAKRKDGSGRFVLRHTKTRGRKKTKA